MKNLCERKMVYSYIFILEILEFVWIGGQMSFISSVVCLCRATLFCEATNLLRVQITGHDDWRSLATQTHFLGTAAKY